MTAQSIADQLNNYDGDNLWQDVILHLDAYDAEATEAADPNAASDIVILKNGSRLEHDGNAWFVKAGR